MSSHSRQVSARLARRSVLIGLVVNGGLALVKGTAGVLGGSQALIADAVESLSDMLGSVVVWTGLRVATSPATENHPYGKGKAEAIAAGLIATLLFVAALAIGINAVRGMASAHDPPAAYTLAVLVMVIVVKEALFRFSRRVGRQTNSLAVQADAWHHRSDALTSLAALAGIAIAVVGGPQWAVADNWAALIAAAVMCFNAYHLARPAVGELTDETPSAELVEEIRRVAFGIKGVKGTHRCWVRKVGFDYFVDLDILVDGSLSVRQGHDLAHQVNDEIVAALPFVRKVMVHVEPEDEFGRHKLDWEQEHPAD